MNRRTILATIALAIATRVHAGYAARDSWIPVAGHTVTADGRGFNTTIYLSDSSRSMNDVTLSFYLTAQPNIAPRQLKLQLGPGQTAAVDIGSQLSGDAKSAIGALHIRATAPLVAAARVSSGGESRGSEVGGVVNAIPSQFAIGAGESAVLHVPSGSRYKLYAVETRGFPLYFSVVTTPAVGERRLYLAAHEQRSWDLEELFRALSVSSLQISGVNGSGKIIVAGTSIASQTRDFAAWEMSLPTEPRHRMRWPELAAYTAVALALVIAAIYNMKK